MGIGSYMIPDIHIFEHWLEEHALKTMNEPNHSDDWRFAVGYLQLLREHRRLEQQYIDLNREGTGE